jgi:hypothetical protein
MVDLNPRKWKRRLKPTKLLHGKRNATRVDAVQIRKNLENLQLKSTQSQTQQRLNPLPSVIVIGSILIEGMPLNQNDRLHIFFCSGMF